MCGKPTARELKKIHHVLTNTEKRRFAEGEYSKKMFKYLIKLGVMVSGPGPSVEYNNENEVYEDESKPFYYIINFRNAVIRTSY
jgi:hypothetical protein